MPRGVYERTAEHRRINSEGHKGKKQSAETIRKAVRGLTRVARSAMRLVERFLRLSWGILSVMRHEIRMCNLTKRIALSEEHRRKISEIEETDERSGHPYYARWSNMKDRCYNECSESYQYYGLRGIQMCEAWHDPWTFFNYLDDELGSCPPGHTLDRIDVDGNYEPGNVRWASWQEQSKNRRSWKKLKLRHPRKSVWVHIMKRICSENTEPVSAGGKCHKCTEVVTRRDRLG